MGRGRGGSQGQGRGGRQGQGRGGGRGGNNKSEAPPLNSILKASVYLIVHFGIFVNIEGYQNRGLVHISQVSRDEVTKRDDPNEVKLEKLKSYFKDLGQFWIKVISLGEKADGSAKIDCSMKCVDQDDGTDLDSKHVEAIKQKLKEVSQKKSGPVYNVQCDRCHEPGHLKGECLASDEKTFKFLSDEFPKLTIGG